MASRLLLGTMGWDYSFWSGVFYPKRFPVEQRLGFYATRFSTVEIDSTFYNFPLPEAVAHWVERTPKDFKFSLKMPARITHLRRLKDCQDDLHRFCDLIRPLGRRLGPVCIQLHPNFLATKRPDLERFLTWLPPRMRFAIEFRHPSWEDPAIHRLLRAHKVAWVNTDRHRGFVRTAKFGYVRLRGDRKLITRFDRLQVDRSEEIAKWASTIKEERHRFGDFYIYASKYFEGYSPGTVERLEDALGSSPGRR